MLGGFRAHPPIPQPGDHRKEGAVVRTLDRGSLEAPGDPHGEVRGNGWAELCTRRGALEFERHFLAPLYKFMSVHPRTSTRIVPAYVSFFLQYLARQV